MWQGDGWIFITFRQFGQLRKPWPGNQAPGTRPCCSRCGHVATVSRREDYHQSPSLSHCLIFADIWHSHCFDDFANFAKKKQYGYRKYRLHALQWVRNVKLLSTCIQHYTINNLQVLCIWTYVAVEMPPQPLPLPLLLNRMSWGTHCQHRRCSTKCISRSQHSSVSAQILTRRQLSRPRPPAAPSRRCEPEVLQRK